MYEQISKQQFVEIMNSLTSQPVWLKVLCDSVSVDTLYPEFEFLEFKNGDCQFGHLNYNVENEHQNVLINFGDINMIHRDVDSSLFGSEQLILTMNDGVNISLETN